MKASLSQRLAAETVGTAFLLAIVIGSGIMGERLSNGIMAIALLANSLATGCGLAVLILVFAPISGAHLNPVVTLVAAMEKDLAWKEVAAYIVAQVLGAFIGVACAHSMFSEPLFSESQKIRTGAPLWLGEAVATFGLLMVILSCKRQSIRATPLAVASFITSAYWFSSSTAFANPAVTLARSWSNTFAGIRPGDAPAFLIAQFVGALSALLFVRWVSRAL